MQCEEQMYMQKFFQEDVLYKSPKMAATHLWELVRHQDEKKKVVYVW